MPAQNSSQRPGHQGRGAARTAVVWEALQDVLAAVPADAGDQTASVLDIGAGTGGFAVRVAELGHRVTVIDPSPDALAILARRAEERGVADLVTGRQGDLASLHDLVPAGRTDGCCATGAPRSSTPGHAALASIAEVLRPAHQPAGQPAACRGGRGPWPLHQAGSPRRHLGGSHRQFTADEITTVLDRRASTPPPCTR
jgi:SAM-dependent methyltransferase